MLIINNPSLLPKTIDSLAKQSREWSPQQWAGYLMAVKKNKLRVHLIKIINRVTVIKLAFPELYHLLLNVVLGNSLAPMITSNLRLSKRHQQVLEGYFIRGMSNTEIANALGLKVNTIYNYKVNAIRKLYRSVGNAFDILDMASWPLIKIAPHRFPSPEIRLLQAIFSHENKK